VRPPRPDRWFYATTIAKTCVAELGAAADQCKTKPIWVPGKDVPEVAEHDGTAMLAGSPPVLTAMSSTEREAGYVDENGQLVAGLARNWYRYTAPCVGNVSSDTGLSCDEYPYFSTAESSLTAHLALVDQRQNTTEGRNRYQMMYSSPSTGGCGLLSKPNPLDRQFIVVPEPDALPTLAMCG
jgi:hypothetical protein